jgi:molybdate transport system permease protein
VTRPYPLLFAALAAVALAFLALPIVALLTAIPLRDLPTLLSTPAVVDAIVVSLRANLIANVLILGIGTPAAYALARSRRRGRGLLLTLIELPLVLPPAVAGIALLTAFGARGLLGDMLAARGIVLPFTEVAVVLAVTFVAAPFFLRAAISTFATLERDQLDAARDLGASEWTVFHRVALPLAADGLRAGWALAFARGAGEFGATLLFAGSVMRVTQTLPLAVYAQLGVDLDAAIAIGILLLALSALVLVISKLPPLWSPAAPSASGSGW